MLTHAGECQVSALIVFGPEPGLANGHIQQEEPGSHSQSGPNFYSTSNGCERVNPH